MTTTQLNRTTFLLGQDRVRSLKHMLEHKQRILVVSDTDSMQDSVTYEKVIHALLKFSWLHVTYAQTQVQSQSFLSSLNNIAAIAKKENIDFVLAVGNTPALNGARYIAASQSLSDAIPVGVVLTKADYEPDFTVLNEFLIELEHMSPEFVMIEPEVLKSLPTRKITRSLSGVFSYVLNQYLNYPTTEQEQLNSSLAFLKSLIALGETFHKQDELWPVNYLWVVNHALGGYIGADAAKSWAMQLIGNQLAASYDVDFIHSPDFGRPSLHQNEDSDHIAKLEKLGKNVFELGDENDLVSRTTSAIEHFYKYLDTAPRTKHTFPMNYSSVIEMPSLIHLHGAMQENVYSETQSDMRKSMTLQHSEVVLEHAMALQKL